ncbi:hypothetical protein pb186bvf_005129 [Paramecium bursaria]
MAELLRQSYLSNSSQQQSQGERSERQTSKLLGNKIFKKKMTSGQTDQSYQEQKHQVFTFHQNSYVLNNQTSLISDDSSQVIEQSQILDFNPTSEAFDENNKFKARFLEKLVEQQKQKQDQRQIKTEKQLEIKIPEKQAEVKSKTPERTPDLVKDKQLSKTPERTPDRVQSRMDASQSTIQGVHFMHQDNRSRFSSHSRQQSKSRSSDVSLKMKSIPVLQADVTKSNKQSIVESIKIEDQSPKNEDLQVIDQTVMYIQFELKTKIIKVPIYQNDDSYKITYRIMKKLNCQSNTQIIEKTADLIEQHVNDYIERLQQLVQQYPKLDGVQFKALTYSNKNILQDVEDNDVADTRLPTTDRQHIGSININVKDKFIGVLKVYPGKEPYQTVLDFINEHKVQLNKDLFQRIVDEVYDIQLQNHTVTPKMKRVSKR